jgi:hypothetical protein
MKFFGILRKNGNPIPAFCIWCVISTGLSAESGEVVADDVRAAFDRLSMAENYTFSASASDFKGGTEDIISGTTERSGWTFFRLKTGEVWQEFIFNGKRGVVGAGDQWITLEELQSEEFRAKLPADLNFSLGRTVMTTLASFKTPPSQAVSFLAEIKAFKKDGDRLVGDVRSESLAKLFGPSTKRYTFWVELEKGLPMKWGYQQVKEIPGEEKAIPAEVTFRITELGTTEIKIPTAAKKRLE